MDVFERTLLEERASARQNASEAGKVGGEMKDLAFGEFSAAAHGLERFLQVQHVIVIFVPVRHDVQNHLKTNTDSRRLDPG